MGRASRRPTRGIADCFGVTVGVAALLTLLLTATYAPTRQAPPPPRARPAPLIWQRLGAADESDVARAARVADRRAVFRLLIDEYLAPWSAATAGGTAAPISAALLDSMEVPLRSYTAARVRLSAQGTVLYRIVEHWDKTYRLARVGYFLGLIAHALKRYPALRALPAEFYVNAADGPRVTVDSASRSFAGLPLFGFRTEKAHIDIPVPDPVEHGSHVTGHGYVVDAEVRANALAWPRRREVVVFRGTSSSIMEMRHENWFLNPRVRVGQISAKYADVVDAGVSRWAKLANGTSVEDVLKSANITTKESMSLEEQLRYKYILDVDGGLGSSRKRWILQSGSVPFFQQSTVYQWYEPLLTPWVHYVPVDRWFRNLVVRVRWARGNDRAAQEIVRNAEEFADKYLSEDAIIEYVAILLQKYATLMKDVRRFAQQVPNPCVEAPIVEAGPMGCRTDWLVFEPNKTLPFGCRHKPLEHLKFVCHRKNPTSGKKEVKHGIYSSYDNDYDVVWRVHRAKQLEEEKKTKRAAVTL